MFNRSIEEKYIDLVNDIINYGEPVYNERTKSETLVLLNRQLTWDANKENPIIRSRQINWRGAIAEMLAYLKGYTTTEQFAKIGTKTWHANAKNPAWVNSPFYGVYGDIGLIYGALGNEVPYIEPSRTEPLSGRFWTWGKVKVLENIYNSLKEGKDDRGLIWNFWNPGMHHLGCLRACMYDHQFSLLNGKLHLTSKMRSCDVALGLTYNMIQCQFLLQLMAHITGHQVGTVTMNIVNAHLYQNQVNDAHYLITMWSAINVEKDEDFLKVEPFIVSDEIKTLEDVQQVMTLEHVDCDYDSRKHESVVIKFPFTV